MAKEKKLTDEQVEKVSGGVIIITNSGEPNDADSNAIYGTPEPTVDSGIVDKLI